MENIELKESSIADVLRYGPVSHVDDDLLLIEDLSQVPKASMPRRNHDIIIGLCLAGESDYTLNTEEHIVRPDDALIIPNGQVIDACLRKPGTTGVGIMMSPDSAGWKKTLDGDSTEWKHYWAPGGTLNRNLANIGINTIPYYIVTTSIGKQLYRGNSIDEAIATAEKQMQEGAATGKKK